MVTQSGDVNSQTDMLVIKLATACDASNGVVQRLEAIVKGTRSLYSLRHTCIMYRLLYGEGLNLLTLARNARTSTEMIECFYASHLEGEMNTEILQSQRGKK